MSWIITNILMLYTTWVSQHTNTHPTEQFISIYLSLWARCPAWFYSLPLLYNTTFLSCTLFSQRTMESGVRDWLQTSFCLIISSSSQIYKQCVACYYSQLQLCYSGVNIRSVVAKLVATFLDYYKHIIRVLTCNLMCNLTGVLCFPGYRHNS